VARGCLSRAAVVARCRFARDQPPGALIRSQLYVADPVTQLFQYMLSGVGGMRALAALGIEPGLAHLNEGHAAFALSRGESARGAPVKAALTAPDSVRCSHTPPQGGQRRRTRASR